MKLSNNGGVLVQVVVPFQGRRRAIYTSFPPTSRFLHLCREPSLPGLEAGPEAGLESFNAQRTQPSPQPRLAWKAQRAGQEAEAASHDPSLGRLGQPGGLAWWPSQPALTPA